VLLLEMNEWMKVVATMAMNEWMKNEGCCLNEGCCHHDLIMLFFDIPTMILSYFFFSTFAACRLRGVRITPAPRDANVRNLLEKWETQT
jgi:hypothetical protein